MPGRGQIIESIKGGDGVRTRKQYLVAKTISHGRDLVVFEVILRSHCPSLCFHVHDDTAFADDLKMSSTSLPAWSFSALNIANERKDAVEDSGCSRQESTNQRGIGRLLLMTFLALFS